MMRCITMEHISISQKDGYPHEVIVLRKRSEGRLKTYISNLDIRSWGASDYERQEFIQEFINHPEWYSGISKSFYLPSSSVLAGALLAKKNSDLKRLKDLLTSQGHSPSGDEQQSLQLVNRDGIEGTSDSLHTDVNYTEAGEEKEQPPLLLVNEEGIESTSDTLYTDVNYVEAGEGEEQPPLPLVNEEAIESTPDSLPVDYIEANKRKEVGSVDKLAVEDDSIPKTLPTENEYIVYTPADQDDVKKPSPEFSKPSSVDILNNLKSLEKENSDLREIISSLEHERDNLKNELLKQRKMSSEQRELLEQRRMSKEQNERIRGDDAGCSKECLQKLIEFKEREREFLMSHLMKMDTLLTAITECAKMKERLADPRKGQAEKAMEDENQCIADLENELEEKDEIIDSLEQQLRDALRREECLQQAMSHSENKMKEVRRRSIELEDELLKEGRERGKLMQSFQSDQNDLERLKKENAEMSELQKKMDEERDRLRREQEEQENSWRKTLEEMNGKLEAHEKEKERLSTQLDQYMNDEIITPKRASELEELSELKRLSIEREEQAEKDRDCAKRTIEALECELENLRGCLFCKNKELENLRKETKTLKECIICLETNKNTLEKTIADLREEKETMKEKWEDERLHALEVTLEKLEFEIEYQMTKGGSCLQLTSTNAFDTRGSTCTCAKSDTDLYHSTDRFATLGPDTECVEYNNIDECDNYLQSKGSDDFHASGCTCNRSRGDTDLSPITDRFRTLPVNMDPDVDSRWMTRKTNERNSRSPDFMSGVVGLGSDFKEVSNYKMGIWERDEIVVLKSPCP